jgi:hypothetical protein
MLRGCSQHLFAVAVDQARALQHLHQQHLQRIAEEEEAKVQQRAGLDRAKLVCNQTKGIVMKVAGGRPSIQVAPALKEMPVPVPATPRPKARPRWGLYAGVTAILAACGLVMGVLVQGSRSYAESGDAAGETTHTGGVSVPLSAEQVLFSVEPLDAHVFQGSVDLGAGPFLFQIPVGHLLTLEI